MSIIFDIAWGQYGVTACMRARSHRKDMPEGDTIYRAARALQKALGGKVVTGFDTALAPIARVNDDTPLVGRTVERVESRGKWCLIFFSGDLILVTHMLMSGSWHIYRTGEKWWMGRSRMRVAIRVGGVKSLATTDRYAGLAESRSQRLKPGSEQHDYGTAEAAPLTRQGLSVGSQGEGGSGEQQLSFGNDNGKSDSDVGFEAVAFNVPVVEFHTARSLERNSYVPKLGPDVLSGEFTVEDGVTRLEEYAREHPEAQVGVTLLNQRVLAGLGNVYKSEVAFAARVNPFRQMRTVTAREREEMVQFAVRWMKANVHDGSGPRETGQEGLEGGGAREGGAGAGLGLASGEGIVTYTGIRRTTHSARREDRLWVYGRQGQECRRCGATVMMRKQGEQARSTYWCPACQPWVPADGQSTEAPVGGQFGSRRRKVGC